MTPPSSPLRLDLTLAPDTPEDWRALVRRALAPPEERRPAADTVVVPLAGPAGTPQAAAGPTLTLDGAHWPDGTPAWDRTPLLPARVTLTLPDGSQHHAHIDTGDDPASEHSETVTTWEDLETWADDIMGAWAHDTMVLLSQVSAAARDERRARAAADTARAERNRLLRRARAAGITTYRLAQVARLGETAVARATRQPGRSR